VIRVALCLMKEADMSSDDWIATIRASIRVQERRLLYSEVQAGGHRGKRPGPDGPGMSAEGMARVREWLRLQRRWLAFELLNWERAGPPA
jgi:hypothetical protein